MELLYNTQWVKQGLCCAKLLQSCPTLCDPTDYGLPGSSVHGVLQARRLKWVHLLLPGSCPTQGLTSLLLGLLHWQVVSLPLGPPGKPPKRVCYYIISSFIYKTVFNPTTISIKREPKGRLITSHLLNWKQKRKRKVFCYHNIQLKSLKYYVIIVILLPLERLRAQFERQNGSHFSF